MPLAAATAVPVPCGAGVHDGSCPYDDGNARKGSRPNIIFIFADDLGGKELGCCGNVFNETPVLDSMANLGVSFCNGYASAPISSPSRAGLLSGQYPARNGIMDFIKPKSLIHLDTSLVTLPKVLSSNGYHTCIIGKLHLSGYIDNGAPLQCRPEDYGFDEVIMTADRSIGNGTYFYPYDHIDGLDLEPRLEGEREFLVDRMNLEAVDFIDRNTDRPFFLYLSHYAVHSLVHGEPGLVDHFRSKPGCGHSAPSKQNPENDPYKKWPADYKANYNNPHQAAQLKVMDEGVGMIVDRLEKLGMLENTIIIFTSDNGGSNAVTDNGILRDGKGSLYEGGIREPVIVWQKGRIEGGKILETPMFNCDFYPTICELTGTPLPENYVLDGVSLVRPLTGGKEIHGRPLFWHFNTQERKTGGRNSSSVLLDDWKLVRFHDTGVDELYNIRKDEGETINLIDVEKRQARKLIKLLDEWDEQFVLPTLKPYVRKSDYGRLASGEQAHLYRISNSHGASMEVTDYGCRIVSINMPDNKGIVGDVVVGYLDLDSFENGDRFIGPVIGRYGNRIDHASFSLDGVLYELDANEVLAGEKVQCHGGTDGFDRYVWDAEMITEKERAGVRFHRVSPDGEQGYPGNLDTYVTYWLTEDNTVKLEYSATTDEPTVVNLSNHTYFNLSGGRGGNVMSHLLTVQADSCVQNNLHYCPDLVLPVEGSPFDFREPHRMDYRIDMPNRHLEIMKGMSACWVLRDYDGSMREAANLYDGQTGRGIKVYTTEPALLTYTGRGFSEEKYPDGKYGPIGQFGGMLLETIHFPDSPNQPRFPSTVLRPGEKYYSTTEFHFYVK
ncbi:MAG: sulfatase-like hydrolase/transferase [Bacteroidales bacterium]|nr:sulfatase-like hydrolase/transferase [Bacteroidales bacterium]